MIALFKNPVLAQRLARCLWRAGIPIVPQLLTYGIRVWFSCFIPHQATVGRRVVLGYGGLGVVIHKDAVLGDGCHLGQGVTIGGNAVGPGVPVLGERVYVGAGAKVIGPVLIGDDAVIGANAVVLCDVPPGAVAVGVPARVIERR